MEIRLGQVPLVLGPSSWGSGMLPPTGTPLAAGPFWGVWRTETDEGRVGPFSTPDGARRAAREEVGKPAWITVRDARGRLVR